MAGDLDWLYWLVPELGLEQWPYLRKVFVHRFSGTDETSRQLLNILAAHPDAAALIAGEFAHFHEELAALQADLHSLEERIKKAREALAPARIPTPAVEEEPNSTEPPEPVVGPKGPAEDPAIRDMGFSVRTFNLLRKKNIQRLSELKEETEEDLMNIRHFGRKSLLEVRGKLAQYGIILPTGKML